MHEFSPVLGSNDPESLKPALKQMRTCNMLGDINIRNYEELLDGFENYSSALKCADKNVALHTTPIGRHEVSRARRGRAMIAYMGKYKQQSKMPDQNIDFLAELMASKEETEDLLGLADDQSTRGLTNSLADIHNGATRLDEREIMANHAETLSYIARIITREQVIANKVCSNKRLSPEEALVITAEQKYYGLDYAHGFALLGNKPLVIVENAMYGARAEIIKGGLSSKLHAGFWIGRASKGLLRTMLHNPSRTGHALRVIKDVGPTIRSRKSAIGAIRKDV